MGPIALAALAVAVLVAAVLAALLLAAGSRGTRRPARHHVRLADRLADRPAAPRAAKAATGGGWAEGERAREGDAAEAAEAEGREYFDFRRGRRAPEHAHVTDAALAVIFGALTEEHCLDATEWEAIFAVAPAGAATSQPPARLVQGPVRLGDETSLGGETSLSREAPPPPGCEGYDMVHVHTHPWGGPDAECADMRPSPMDLGGAMYGALFPSESAGRRTYHGIMTIGGLTLYGPSAALRAAVAAKPRGAAQVRAATQSIFAVVAAETPIDGPSTSSGMIARLERAGAAVSFVPAPDAARAARAGGVFPLERGTRESCRAFQKAAHGVETVLGHSAAELAEYASLPPLAPPTPPPPFAPFRREDAPSGRDRNAVAFAGLAGLVPPEARPRLAAAERAAERVRAGEAPDEPVDYDVLGALRGAATGWDWPALAAAAKPLAAKTSWGTVELAAAGAPPPPGAPPGSAGARFLLRPKGGVIRPLRSLPSPDEWARVLERTLAPGAAGAPYDVVVSRLGAVAFGPGPALLAARAPWAASAARFALFARLFPAYATPAMTAHEYAAICARAGVAIALVAGPGEAEGASLARAREPAPPFELWAKAAESTPALPISALLRED